MMAACSICNIHNSSQDRSRYEIARTSLWVLRHHPDPSPLKGWLILDSIRHISGPIAFSPMEASNWGFAVQRASNLVSHLTGCNRVYSIAFGEGAYHLHLHLIPRSQGDSRTESWKVADLYRAVAKMNKLAIQPSTIKEIVEEARALYPSFEITKK